MMQLPSATIDTANIPQISRTNVLNPFYINFEIFPNPTVEYTSIIHT